VLVAGLLAARAAEASPPKASAGDVAAGDTRKTDARARFERGVGLFMDGNYESALVEFRTSIHDYPTRTTAVNIAVCLRKLGRYDEEQEALQALEASFPATSEADAADLERSKAAVADHLGTIRISGAPSGAQIFVDGRLRGATPLAAPLVVSSGARVLRVELAHYVTFEKRFELPAKKIA
jgi:tetratricopeptide (TPR) repeat protein